ncbi:glycosyltransferase [Microbacterium sp. E-13]|uniref:glycosyltransferase n=1 Tax=Microbacterium sp. E-13 TaxID=3404048 RepID=UPI003CEFEEB4
MPHVAIIGTRGYPSYYGGFETAIRKLAPYLVEHGWTVSVYSRAGAVRKNDPDLDPRVNVIYTRGLEKKSLSTLSFGYTASRDAIKRGADVALVMNVANGFFLPMLKRAGIPTLVNVDGIEWVRAKWGILARTMFKRGAALTARYGDELVYDARAIAGFWKREFGRDGVFIPYGGDPVEELPVEPGYKSGEYALVVARFVPENTVPEFVEAAREIARTRKVIFVGSTGYGGELDEQVRDLADSNENVAWFGHVADDKRLFALWQHAGAYFHGHSVGGTNPALVQAMAAGAPVVARDTVYNREVLGDKGTFTSAEPSDIARSVLEMLDSPSRQAAASELSRARAEAEYTWSMVCGRYDRSLRALLSEMQSAETPARTIDAEARV